MRERKIVLENGKAFEVRLVKKPISVEMLDEDIGRLEEQLKEKKSLREQLTRRGEKNGVP